MPLLAPNLDDRRFQDLVDDAKRLVQERSDKWTDHNVSDPGVTLIEAFAWMTDQLLYRLNRVPDRNYVKFLELIGVHLYPPAAAQAEVTFWLSAPQPSTVTIPAGTEVATVRTGEQPPVVFSTSEERAIVTTNLARVASSKPALDSASPNDETVTDLGDGSALKKGVFPYSSPPVEGESFLIALNAAAPGCVVNLRFTCRIEGHGVDPDNPPLAWEAWTADGWRECGLEKDLTGGINRDGDVILHVPPEHVTSTKGKVTGGWLRAVITEARTGQPVYSASPEVRGLVVTTIGGTAKALNAELIKNEYLGESEGVPGGRFQLRRAPVVAGEKPLTLEVRVDDAWEEWTQRPNFAASGPDDRHFVLDQATGEIQLGPGVRMEDGTQRRYGAVPPRGAGVRIPSYRAGGGQAGNVAAGTLSVLKASIPYVTKVGNRKPALGGVDGEDIESAKVRGPIVLRTRDRAVTAEDFEFIAKEVAPEVARVRAIPVADGAEAGAVRVLLVPAVPAGEHRTTFDQLLPAEETLERISRRLDETRLIGTRVVVEPASYRPVTIEAVVRARPRTDHARLERDALDALYRYFHPTTGGPDGAGWPFGRPIVAGEVHSVLQRVRGTELVENVTIQPVNPKSGERGKPADRVEVDANSLVFSFDHKVTVEGDA